MLITPKRSPLPPRSLPTDLLQALGSLDVLSLCRLACVSVAFRQLTDDAVAWSTACGCGGRRAGHCKGHARLQHLQVCMVARELAARDELKRKQKLRLWKRRVAHCLQAVCGAALILLPLFLLHRRTSAAQTGRAHPLKGLSPSNGTRPASVAASHAFSSSNDGPKLRYADVVWDAACSSRRPAQR